MGGIEIEDGNEMSAANEVISASRNFGAFYRASETKATTDYLMRVYVCVCV